MGDNTHGSVSEGFEGSTWAAWSRVTRLSSQAGFATSWEQSSAKAGWFLTSTLGALWAVFLQTGLAAAQAPQGPEPHWD